MFDDSTEAWHHKVLRHVVYCRCQGFMYSTDKVQTRKHILISSFLILRMILCGYRVFIRISWLGQFSQTFSSFKVATMKIYYCQKTSKISLRKETEAYSQVCTVNTRVWLEAGMAVHVNNKQEETMTNWSGTKVKPSVCINLNMWLFLIFSIFLCVHTLS